MKSVIQFFMGMRVEEFKKLARQYHDLIDEISIEQAAQEDLSSTDIDYQDSREYPDWG
ncbi:MAG: hypothetical protein ACYTXT_38040 [Nostoc sp.]